MTDLIDRQVNDLIGREKAINTAHSMRKVCDTDNIDDYHDLIVAALKDLPPSQHWILCSERLPEEDGQYLITVKYKHVNDNYEDIYAEHGEWYDSRWDMFCFGHCGEVEDIIAWMPLPEPYEDGEQSDRTYQ